MDKLREDLPEHIVLYIANIPIRDANDNDYAVWNITRDGQYTISSAWQSIREVRQKGGILSKVWHKCLPFKIPFLPGE